MTYPRLPMKRLGDIFLGKMLQGKPKSSADVAAPYLRAAHVQPQGRLIDVGVKTMWFSEQELKLHDLRADDVVIVEGGAGYGRSAVVPEDRPGWGFQNSIIRVRPRCDIATGRFLSYALQSALAAGEIEVACFTATIPHFTADKVSAFPVPAPPFDTQRAIAAYLDRETAGIDTLIEEQQRLIEMLRERREATIRSALLSGLDAADKRPSGVELLGAIPGHWRMVPTRYLCTITTGSEDSGNATEDGDYPFYVRGREVLRINHYSFDGEAVMTPGDGQGGTGKVFHYFKGKFEAHQRVYVFKDFVDVSGWYFYYFLSTFLRPVALAGSNTVTMESLRRPLLADFKIAVPPLDEQRRITAYLDDQSAKIDTLIAEAERFIELARERRSALITAAVTGQIDVREVA
ncbi:restriction endonuclease subunit S [Spirillospora sp. CA-253888]